MKKRKLYKRTSFGTRLGIFAVFLSAMTLTNAFSEEGHKAPLSAHEHGHGELMIAQDGQELVVELHLPGADVVGFEHHPQTHEQEHAVEEAVKRLKETKHWLLFSQTADCRVEDMHVSSPLASDPDDHKDGHDDHSGDHKDEHAEDTHAEFKAEYHFHCDAPGKLNGFEIGLFKVFPSLEEIEYQAIVSRGQFGGELNAGQSSVEF